MFTELLHDCLFSGDFASLKPLKHLTPLPLIRTYCMHFLNKLIQYLEELIKVLKLQFPTMSIDCSPLQLVIVGFSHSISLQPH